MSYLTSSIHIPRYKMKNTSRRKKLVSIIINSALVGIILLMFFNPAAKAWVLRQLLHTGFFSAEIEKHEAAMRTHSNNAFSFRDMKGNVVSTTDLQGKVVFVNFWASWCPPCRAEMPDLDKLFRELENDPRIVFVFINEDSDLKKAETYLSNDKYSIPIMQTEGSVPPHLYTGTLPTTIILDKNGRVVFRHEGLARYDTDKFRDQLKALL